MERRSTDFVYECLVPGSVKDKIKAAGVPHTEVDLIVVNGGIVDFAYVVRGGDRIAVYPEFQPLEVPSLLCSSLPDENLWFALDTHLGRLAGYLRMLGFDCVYGNSFTDDQLADLSSNQNRGLLQRGQVKYGYYVRGNRTAPASGGSRLQVQIAVPVSAFSTLHSMQHALAPDREAPLLNRLPERAASLFDQFKNAIRVDVSIGRDRTSSG